MPFGTAIEATVRWVVDGDTIRVFLPGEENDESLRILCLDTEESRSTGDKPETPWGHEAKKRAEVFFSPGDKVRLEFPGSEGVDVCTKKYRGNYGRLLVFVHKNGVDFQETMIREGYSPYFMKYGNAAFHQYHEKYSEAEKLAQEEHLGVWDQIRVNQTEIRNYASLGTWWRLRAEIIDRYRAIKNQHENLYNTRLDFDEIVEMANKNQSVVVFTELREIRRISQGNALISIGSIKQPFSLFLPGIDSDDGQKVIRLLKSRYISVDLEHPNRSYAYVSGELSVYKGDPQIVIRSSSQITDEIPRQP